MSEKPIVDEHDANRDPLTGEPGAHPVGTGVGAAGAGATGAAIGAVVGGPIGAVVGTVVGAVAGGLAGKGVAERINPTEEHAYWRDNHASQSYVEPNEPYEYYEPAYRTGYEGYARYYDTGITYDQIEPDLQRDYELNRGGSGLGWEKARYATRAAWDKVERAVPGDIDRDGR
jgi:hypothetical protein